ncbi:alpha/beta hydrolase [Sphingomonas sp.]|uniref:alpha/beta hydrolase n=1 Tax=Sphingomonas sp. TaxID=28214 RepID=UPI0035BC5DA4
MLVDRRMLLGGAMAVPLSASAAGAQAAPARIALWAGPPPGATSPPPRFHAELRRSHDKPETWLTGIAVPAIEIYRPMRSNGVGLLSIPGGGYAFLAITNEGSEVARVFTALGYTVAVLTYRLPAEGWRDRADVPLQDAQRAMRVFRAMSARLGLTSIGIAGFSARGHLAASLATGHDEDVYTPADAADRLSARPDFAALIYPVTTLVLPDTHAGSREHLLGTAPGKAEVARRSPVLHVDARTPPSFLLHALDDDIVPVACSLAWLAACRAAAVPVEAHLIEAGGHGFGVGLPTGNSGALWPEQCHRWIRRHTTRV